MSKNHKAGRRVLRYGILAALAALPLVAMGALAEAEAAPDAASVAAREAFAAQQADGKKVYGTVCGACHMADGSGVPGMFPPLAGSEWVTGDEGRLVKVVLHGLTGPIEVKGETYSSSMPPFGTALKDAEIAAVLTYIRSSWGNKADPVTAAQVARIRKENLSRKKPWTAKELALSSATKK